MARKRTYKKRSTGAKRMTKKRASKIDMTVVTLIVISILLAVLIYTKSGVVGAKLNEILGGMMGIIQYVLPIGIFAIAIKIACDENDGLSSKIIQYVIFIISIAVLMSTFEISTGQLTTNKELSEVVKDAYSLGASGIGGGAIGAALAVPLVNLLGEIGAIILSIGIAVILLVFMFGINLSDIINEFVEKIYIGKYDKETNKRNIKIFWNIKES